MEGDAPESREGRFFRMVVGTALVIALAFGVLNLTGVIHVG